MKVLLKALNIHIKNWHTSFVLRTPFSHELDKEVFYYVKKQVTLLYQLMPFALLTLFLQMILSSSTSSSWSFLNKLDFKIRKTQNKIAKKPVNNIQICHICHWYNWFWEQIYMKKLSKGFWCNWTWSLMTKSKLKNLRRQLIATTTHCRHCGQENWKYLAAAAVGPHKGYSWFVHICKNMYKVNCLCKPVFYIPW